MHKHIDEMVLYQPNILLVVIKYYVTEVMNTYTLQLLNTILISRILFTYGH